MDGSGPRRGTIGYAKPEPLDRVAVVFLDAQAIVVTETELPLAGGSSWSAAFRYHSDAASGGGLPGAGLEADPLVLNTSFIAGPNIGAMSNAARRDASSAKMPHSFPDRP